MENEEDIIQQFQSSFGDILVTRNDSSFSNDARGIRHIYPVNRTTFRLIPNLTTPFPPPEIIMPTEEGEEPPPVKYAPDVSQDYPLGYKITMTSDSELIHPPYEIDHLDFSRISEPDYKKKAIHLYNSLSYADRHDSYFSWDTSHLMDAPKVNF